MARKAAMTVILAAVLGLGVLAGVGTAVPWKDWREARADRRLAGAARAEELFALRVRLYAEGGWRPAQPMSTCDACIQAAAEQRLTPAEIRVHCGAACAVE